MTSQEEGLKDQISLVLDRFYTSVLKEKLSEEVKFMNEIVEAVNTFYATPAVERNLFSNLAEYKAKLRDIIEDRWPIPEEDKEFLQQFDGLEEAMNEIFSSLPYSKVKEQKEERFFSQKDDSFFLKVIKLFKRCSYFISQIPVSIANIFRKGKQKRRYWKHRIFVRNLAKYHLQSNFILDLRDVADIYFTTVSDMYLSIKLWEEHLINVEIGLTETPKEDLKDDVEKKLKGLKRSFSAKIKNKLEELLNQRFDKYYSDFDKVGTIEFSSSNISDEEIIRDTEKAAKRWGRHNREWENTIYALFEEWRSDLEIYSLRNYTRSTFEDYQVAQFKKLVEQIDPEIDTIRSFIAECEESLSHKSFSDDATKILKRVGYQATKRLDGELIPKLSDRLISQNLANIINKLELEIKQHVEELSDEHVIVKTRDYDIPIKNDDLKSISPYELIAFEALSKFQEELEDVKQALFSTLETTNADILDIGQIIAFSADSAVSAIEDEAKSNEEALKVANEGLKRARGRLDKAREELEQSLVANSEKLEGVVNTFCERLMELTVNENVGELRLRITRAKAAKQAEEIKEEIREKVRARRRHLMAQISLYFNRTVAHINRVRERFVLTKSRPVITRQISDFLMESQLAIDSLPLIYRRLYRIEPLEDLELFEGRIEEFQRLHDAFQNWNQGRYAATSILGEKWGGLTTFLNYVVQRENFPYPIVRFATRQNIYDEQGLIQLMKEVFQHNEFENLDQVVDYLNAGVKRVVILEDLQNLYLRKVGGFAALQLLFQLITRTYNKIFWITSTTLYTWQYLSRTIHINEFFSYVIELGTLTDEQIVNIIWKRNRISGYNIQFEVNEEHTGDKRFQKLTEKEQQLLLKKEYFSSLNEFAKSNISLALIFWLLSTRSVDERTITIGSFKKPDLNFMSVLSMEKVHTLHALILHDGLSEGQLQDVLNLTESYARLNLLALVEDGIVMKKGKVYVVNPIIYRNTIAMLKDKNLIH